MTVRVFGLLCVYMQACPLSWCLFACFTTDDVIALMNPSYISCDGLLKAFPPIHPCFWKLGASVA